MFSPVVAKLPRSVPFGENLRIVLPVKLETYRLPLASKARAVGVCSPVVAKSPRSTPVGENSRMVSPPWLATKRFSAQAGAPARLSAIQRLPIVKWKQVLEERCIAFAPFESMQWCWMSVLAERAVRQDCHRRIIKVTRLLSTGGLPF